MAKQIQAATLDKLARTDKNLKGVFDIEKVATWDIEAEDWTDVALVGVYYPSRDKYFEFKSMEAFVDHALTAGRAGTHFWAHNAGRYDTNLLWEEIMDNTDYEFSIIDTAGSIIKLTITDTESDTESLYRWYFHDSFHLVSGSLDELTHKYDVKHKKQSEFDLDKIKADVSKMSHQDQKELSNYLKYDCKGLWEVLQKFNQQIKDLGGVTSLTKASTAMNTWRVNYFPSEVEGIYNYQDLEPYIKNAYFGGRTEVFKRYGEDISVYDINSLYPSVMVKPLPIGSPTYKENNIDLKAVDGVVAAEVEAPDDMNVPILPVKNRIGNSTKLIFPTGRFRGAWDSEELKRAVEAGYKVHEIIWAVDFPREYPVFKDYVNKLYEEKTKLKKQGEKGARYKTVKVLLNSLYGKTAMHRQQGDIIQHPTEDTIREHLKNGDSVSPYNEKLDIWEFSGKTDANYIVPMLAVRITALARLQLWEVLNTYSDNLYYCDTDSVFIDKDLPEEMVDPYELGLWDKEAQLEEAIFLQAKLYAGKKESGGTKMGHKGLREEGLTYEKFKRAYEQGDGKHLAVSWRSPGGWRSSMQGKGKPITVSTKERQPKFRNYKRVWDGNDSEPIRLIYGRPTNLEGEGDPETFQRKGRELYREMAGDVQMNNQCQFYETYKSALNPRKQMILSGQEMLPEEMGNNQEQELGFDSEELKSKPNKIYDWLRKSGEGINFARVSSDIETDYKESVPHKVKTAIGTSSMGRGLDRIADYWDLEGPSELIDLLADAEPLNERENPEDEYDEMLRRHYEPELEETEGGKTILEWSDRLEIEPMELINILKWTDLPESEAEYQEDSIWYRE